MKYFLQKSVWGSNLFWVPLAIATELFLSTVFVYPQTISPGKGLPNREFLAENKIADGIMRKNSTTATLTEYEIERNKKISKVRYIVEQYFGISHLKDRANRARFTAITKNKFDCWYRQAAYNIARGLKILRVATV